jgi:hypothetical protein
MSGVNSPNVHRTWGLKQLESKEAAYGENFSYEEYLTYPGILRAVITSRLFKSAIGLLKFAPVGLILTSLEGRDADQDEGQVVCAEVWFEVR